MCGHVSCSSFAAGLASVSQFVGPRLLKDTPSLVYRRSCRSTLRFARVGSASEACRNRVGTESEPRRNRVGTASEPRRNHVGNVLAPEWASIMLIRWPAMSAFGGALGAEWNARFVFLKHRPNICSYYNATQVRFKCPEFWATLLRSLLAPRPA